MSLCTAMEQQSSSRIICHFTLYFSRRNIQYHCAKYSLLRSKHEIAPAYHPDTIFQGINFPFQTTFFHQSNEGSFIAIHIPPCTISCKQAPCLWRCEPVLLHIEFGKSIDWGCRKNKIRGWRRCVCVWFDMKSGGTATSASGQSLLMR